ncbi:universal stress protein [Herbiconiux liukaitaii]|uniref:universal stress protein n=1 Tax=Herbiconiux liukaitaii TaxID=3342799 RepID=UPI0035BA5DC4
MQPKDEAPATTRVSEERSTGSIVVGVDGSAPSRSAIAWAMRRASLTGAAVVLAHVMDDDGSDVGDGASDPHGPVDLERLRSAIAFLDGELAHAQLLDRSVAVTTELLRGDPLDRLAEASAGRAMVAVGTHKTGFVQGRVFGSRFIQLAALAACTVAFIPNSASSPRHGVVVGVGGIARDEETIRFAAREADRTGQELVIVHCRPASTDDYGPEGSPTRWDPVGDAAEAVARQGHPSLDIRRRTLNRSPAEGLVDGSMSAALVVTGRTHRASDRPGSVGTIVHDVLLNLAAPTVIVHAA